MMNIRIIYVAAILLLLQFAAKAQSSVGSSTKLIHITFAGKSTGEITKMELLNDSLGFDDPDINAQYIITSWHLTFKCKTQFLESFDCKGQITLTDEMIKELEKIHPGCELLFGDFKWELRKDQKLKFPSVQYAFPLALNLTLK
jgi:hypothetical protein